MNQKDYKEIARIMKQYNFGQFGLRKKVLCNDLADYFEREEDEHGSEDLKGFNREQFLKDCGVK